MVVPRVTYTDRGSLRVGVGDARHRLVVRRVVLSRNVGRHHVALILAHMGERPDAVDIADGPQALARAEMLVHRDAVRVSRDADRLQPDPLHARAATSGHQQPVAPHFGSALEVQHIFVTLPS
jgi:hypothetical protein